jgi:hypothetical protein
VIFVEDVTACLVTRGDQPEQMAKILDSLLPYNNVIIWDNSVAGEDMKCAGRYGAAMLARTPFVYFQDDDVLIPQDTQRELLRAHRPDLSATAVWGHGTDHGGYDDLPLVCGGAIVDRDAGQAALARYLRWFLYNDQALYEADFIAGVLYPAWQHIFEHFHIEMEIAQHPSRLVNQPWQKETKLRITNYARSIRDGAMEDVMPIPLEQRAIVPCLICGYHYRKPMMARMGEGYVCLDKKRCEGNEATRRRMNHQARQKV